LLKTAATQSRSLTVQLESTTCTNLKALLKEVTRQSAQAAHLDDDELEQGSSKASKNTHFAFDLEILHEKHRAEQYDQILIAFQDSEAFDAATLAQAIELFQ
jgi:origin recognition complex subunit 3